VKSISATNASETHRCSSSSQIARGYRIGVQASSSMAVIACRTVEFIRAVTENHALARSAAAIMSCR